MMTVESMELDIPTNCQWENCTKPAEWLPVLAVSPDSLTYTRGILTGVPACTDHKQTLNWANFVSGGNWTAIRRSFMEKGLSPPLLENSRLEWQPID